MFYRFHEGKENYTDKHYAMEWADRFNRGTPENHMDTESLKIYRGL